MQAKKTTMMSLLGENYKKFKVPVYQRTYDWKQEHCEKLIYDILESSEREKEHFTGTVVYLNDKDFSDEKVALLIDGQQRVTTVMILLKAITELESTFESDIITKQINDKFLYADTNQFQKVFKLIPTEEDEREYELLMYSRFDQMNSSLGFYANYQVIKNLLERKIKDLDELKAFYFALNRYITIVELVLDKGIDDPQEIFESINSTGLELSQADLIRNFLLMSVDQQDFLYNAYWKPLYRKIGGEQLEDFMYNFLLYKLQRPINAREVYKVFIDLFSEENYTREGMLEELTNISSIYKAFISTDSNYPNEINHYLKLYRDIDQSTMYPFFFKVFLDYEQKLIETSEIIKILKFFINYHIRRIVSGSSSNSLRGLYLNLYSRIFKLEKNKSRYYDSIATYINDLRTKDEVPSNTVFMNNLKVANIYYNRKLTKFILSQIENANSKEKLVTDEMTVEHIMPQTLEDSWVKMLGERYAEIHEEFLHTLGNLSLTGYNSNMSNKSFELKKETLDKKSKANFLNSDVLDKLNWSEAEIKARAERLANNIVDILKPDRYTSKGIRFEPVEMYGYDVEYEDIKGKPFYSYKFINMDIERRPGSYKGMLVEVIQTLDAIDSKIMDDIAINLFNPWEDGFNDRLSTTNEGNPNSFVKIRDGLFLLGSFSAAACVFSIKKLMGYYNIKPNQFEYYVRVTE